MRAEVIRKECPDCDSVNLVFDAEMQQVMCQDCGSLFDEVVEKKRKDEMTFL
ncbi:TFIIB-type zinc ribbon-containing protein [Nanoarchaeota archaeon]